MTSVSNQLLAQIPRGEEITTLDIHRLTNVPHRNVQAQIGVLHRRRKIEWVRDQWCDPELEASHGRYMVGVYRKP